MVLVVSNTLGNMTSRPTFLFCQNHCTVQNNILQFISFCIPINWPENYLKIVSRSHENRTAGLHYEPE